MFIAYVEGKHIDNVKCILKSEFEMKGPTKRILGMKINRDRKNKVLYLSKKSYISKLLTRFGMDHLKTISTPIGQYLKLYYTSTKN